MGSVGEGAPGGKVRDGESVGNKLEGENPKTKEKMPEGQNKVGGEINKKQNSWGSRQEWTQDQMK